MNRRSRVTNLSWSRLKNGLTFIKIKNYLRLSKRQLLQLVTMYYFPLILYQYVHPKQ